MLSGAARGPEVLVVSGRIGFEIVQKAVAAGVAALVAVGAPTSLAVDLAERAGLDGARLDPRRPDGGLHGAPERLAT